MATVITVTQHSGGSYEVIMDGRTTRQLCFGEMLEMVTKLLPPNMDKKYDMHTPAEWERRFNQSLTRENP